MSRALRLSPFSHDKPRSAAKCRCSSSCGSSINSGDRWRRVVRNRASEMTDIGKSSIEEREYESLLALTLLLADLSGFTSGAVYIAPVSNAACSRSNGRLRLPVAHLWRR